MTLINDGFFLKNEINLSDHLFSQISANFDPETATLNRSLIRNCTRIWLKLRKNQIITVQNKVQMKTTL